MGTGITSSAAARLLGRVLIVGTLVVLGLLATGPTMEQNAEAVGDPIWACSLRVPPIGQLRHVGQQSDCRRNERPINLNDPGHLVNVCALNTTGALRFIASASQCTPNETAIQLPGDTAVHLCVRLDNGLIRFANTPCTVGVEQEIIVPPRNQPPTDIGLAGQTVVENAANGTPIGTLTATDPDPSETFTFSLTNDAGGRFQIVGTELRVLNGALLDF